MAKLDYFQELIEEQNHSPKNRKVKIFVFSLILSVIILTSSFYGGYYLAIRTKNIVSDESYEFLKNFDEDSINTINKFDLLFNALAYADDKFYQNLDYDKLDKVAALAVMNSLDDYSSMSSTDDLLNSAVNASVGAIISTSIYNEYTIQHVFEESNAYGVLKRGDRIYAVNNNRVEGAPSEYFRYFTKGGDGTVLDLTIDRPSISGGIISYTRMNVSVTKSLTTSKQAYYIDNLGGAISNELGYIKLLSFTGSAYEDFRKCIEQFEDDQNKALILDLRNNGGGSGEVLDKIASYLIMDKHDYLESNVPIIELENVKSGKVSVFKTTNAYDFIDKPIYILCNKNTASASEALIGAINYYETGVLIGTKTYGKGVAQYADYSKPLVDNDNEDYYISLTIGYYYVYTKDLATYPNGRYTINGIGITPKEENIITDTEEKINLYDDAFIKRANALFNAG